MDEKTLVNSFNNFVFQFELWLSWQLILKVGLFSVEIFNKLYGICQCEHYNPMISLFIPIYNAKLANLMLILHVLISFSRVFRMEYNERVKSLLIVETFRHWRGIFRVFFSVLYKSICHFDEAFCSLYHKYHKRLYLLYSNHISCAILHAAKMAL